VKSRPRSYLLPAALLICLFFCTTAYSEKKNSVNRGDAVKSVNFYNADYNKRAAKSSRDIISYNNIKGKNNNVQQQYPEDSSVYIVKSGDTLFAIAKKSGINLKEIRDINNLNVNSTIYAGMKLKIDKSKEQIKSIKREEAPLKKNNNKKNDISQNNADDLAKYIVKNGDTIFSIAKKTGISLEEIQDLNNLNSNSKIFKGMKLKIPIDRKIEKSTGHDQGTVSSSSKPIFLWPLKKVKGCSRDGKDGVKSIGIVIKGNPGSDVIASENGVVKRVGYMRGYGKYIVVKHGMNYITVYSNLMEIDVKTGDRVEKGGRIGNISEDMTLHFQIDRKGKPENPLDFLPERG